MLFLSGICGSQCESQVCSSAGNHVHLCSAAQAVIWGGCLAQEVTPLSVLLPPPPSRFRGLEAAGAPLPPRALAAGITCAEQSVSRSAERCGETRSRRCSSTCRKAHLCLMRLPLTHYGSLPGLQQPHKPRGQLTPYRLATQPQELRPPRHVFPRSLVKLMAGGERAVPGAARLRG